MVEGKTLALLAAGGYALSQSGAVGATGTGEQEEQKQIVPPGLTGGGGLGLGIPSFAGRPGGRGSQGSPLNVTFKAPELKPREDPQVKTTPYIPKDPKNTGGGGSKDKESKDGKRTRTSSSSSTGGSGLDVEDDAVSDVTSRGGGLDIDRSREPTSDAGDPPQVDESRRPANRNLSSEPLAPGGSGEPTDDSGGSKSKSSKTDKKSNTGGGLVSDVNRAVSGTFDDEPGGGIGEAIGGLF